MDKIISHNSGHQFLYTILTVVTTAAYRGRCYYNFKIQEYSQLQSSGSGATNYLFLVFNKFFSIIGKEEAKEASVNGVIYGGMEGIVLSLMYPFINNFFPTTFLPKIHYFVLPLYLSINELIFKSMMRLAGFRTY